MRTTNGCQHHACSAQQAHFSRRGVEIIAETIQNIDQRECTAGSKEKRDCDENLAAA
jgi:hypothetical protein